MKVNYKILWLDDEINAFIDDEFVDKIQLYLEEKGFAPDILTVAKVSDFFDKLDDSFDFILTDYNMSEKNGAQVIADIREKSIFTEILFYTAQTEWEDIGKLDRISFLQTNKLSGGTHHEKVVDKAINIIDLTIKKFQHIVAMRGMIMHETSTLDAQSMNILKSYLNCNNSGCNNACPNKARCTPLANTISEKLEQHFWEKLCDVCDFINNKNLRKLIKDNYLFSADYKIESLSQILQQKGLADFSNDYKQEIINIRNKFAHAELQKEETGREYFKHGEDGLTFDETFCETIRKDIIKHKRNLDNLQNQI